MLTLTFQYVVSLLCSLGSTWRFDPSEKRIVSSFRFSEPSWV